MEIARALTLTNGINQFSAQFYNETAWINPGKNLVMSPLSANIILALLSLGARGPTQEELNTALHLLDEEFTKSAFGPAIKKYNAIQGVTLDIANKVFVKDGIEYTLNSEFKKSAVDIFTSEAQNLNFAQSKSAAKVINTWVEEKTSNRIKDLISPKVLSEDTRVVLVNAIYFKGNWERKFDARDTIKREFHLNKNDKVEVDAMHMTDEFNYDDIHEWNAKIIELPYEKREMSMVIILPNEIEGLKSIEDRLSSGANLTEILQRTREVKVYLSLPKFKIETSIDLKNVLPQLGIKKIFNTDADLSGLLQSKESMYISEAVHKAFIEVNEDGAEAAAATALVAQIESYVETEEFIANRPFLYFIRTKSDTVFCGRYVGPE